MGGKYKVTIVEARDLVGMDVLSKSDPYVRVMTDMLSETTKVIDNCHDPVSNDLQSVKRSPFVNRKHLITFEEKKDVWNESFEICFGSHSWIKFVVLDKDSDVDDPLGHFKFKDELAVNQKIDQWFKLDNVKSGEIHIVLERIE